MSKNFQRLRPIIVAVILGVTFLGTVFNLNAALWHTTEKDLRDAFGHYTHVITPSPDAQLNAALIDELRTRSGVTEVDGSIQTMGFLKRGTLLDGFNVRTLNWLSPDATLIAGHRPTAAHEALISGETSKRLNLKVGDQIDLAPTVMEGESTTPITISGLVDVPASVLPQSRATLYATADAAHRIAQTEDSPQFSHLFLTLDKNADPELALQGLDYRNIESFIRGETSNSIPGGRLLPLLLMALSFASFLVLILVIRSVYTVRIQQDRRDYSLRRCLGATRRQVFWSVLINSLMVGLVASVIGAVLSLVLVAAICSIPTVPLVFGTSVLSILGAILAGTVVCGLGAIGPARQAMKNTPLGALRDSASAAPTTPKLPIIRLAIFLLAFAALVGSAWLGIVPAAVLAAAVVVVLGLSFITSLTAVTARILPACDATEKIAANPLRASSITSLTAITVAFIVLISSGSASVLASLNKDSDDTVAPEVTIRVDPDQISASEVSELIADLPEVAHTHIVETRIFDLSYAGEEGSGLRGVKVTPELEQVTKVPEYLSWAQPGRLFIGREFDIPHGTPLSISSGTTSRELVTETHPEGSIYAFLDPADFDAFHSPITQEVWLALNPDFPTQESIAAIKSALAGKAVTLGGTAESTTKIADYLGILSALALLLVIVGAIIALVGISNTLRVSVLERTQEIGLQRALGATRSDIRTSLTLEALILSGLGVLLGIVTGITVAIFGTLALANATRLRFGVDVPILFTLGVIAIALTIGVIASLISSRRAIRISPVAAIVAD